MNTDEEFKLFEDLNALTEVTLGCAFRVSNALGTGFLEKVYENALAHELTKAGLSVNQQVPLHVHYDGIVVGDFVADMIVDNRVLIELKAARILDEAHAAQCLNYLRATGLRICLLLNFGTAKLQVKRYIH